MTGLDPVLSAILRNAGELRRDGAGCLFTFHRAARSPEWATLPNRDFYIDIQFLDQLLSYLLSHHWDVVTIEEALRRSAAGQRSRFANFSIDDCYRDTYELVVPVFRKHGVPVTLFVTTGIPDGSLVMWQAGLEQILRDRKTITLNQRSVDISSSERKRAVYETTSAAWDGPHGAGEYSAFCVANAVDAEPVRAMHAISWEMLEELAADSHVEIGSHTVRHPRVSSLDPQAAFAELEQSRIRLEERLRIPVRHFAFPYGRSGDCGDRDFDLAQKAGYLSAATTRKGLLKPLADPFRLPRNTLNGRHQQLHQAELHLTGLSGLAARILNRV